MPHREKKENDPKLVKNHNFRHAHDPMDDSSKDDPPTAAQALPDIHLHHDEEAFLGDALEQGEIMDDSESEGYNAIPHQDLLRMVKQMKTEQGDLTQRIAELTQQQDKSKHEWKKEGLNKQDEIAQKVISKLDLALANLNQHLKVCDLLIDARDILRQRTKELHIADSSDAGWETVNVYRSHPVAEDSDDDRKIRKAEKLAKEHLAVKTKRTQFNRRGGFQRRPYQRQWGNHDDFNPQFKDMSYRGNNSGQGQDAGQRNTYYPNRRRASQNSICFHCGQSSHWQDQCPHKNNNRDH